MGTDHEHRVCTFDQAEAALRAHEKVYVNECFCRGPAREGKTSYPYCGHDTDTCLGFSPPAGNEPFQIREITLEEALKKFEGWKEAGGFFRFMEGEQWLCLCCRCGCGWFRDREGRLARDPCGKSGFLPETDPDLCTLCGLCVGACAYSARRISGDQLEFEPEKCYGCSACENACQEAAIWMVGAS